MSDTKPTERKPTILFHATPALPDCEHDFKGWVEFDDGRGGTTVCTKCGLDAFTYTMRCDW